MRLPAAAGRAGAVRVTALPLVLLAVSGLVAATYQHEVAAQSDSCALGAADRIIQFFDLEERAPKVFMITANCSEAGAYRLLGLPYEIWSGMLFAVCLALGLAWMLRRPGRWWIRFWRSIAGSRPTGAAVGGLLSGDRTLCTKEP